MESDESAGRDTGTGGRQRGRWGPPPDSDLIGIPLIIGIALAVLAIIATYYFVGALGSVVLLIVLIAALAISYRVVIDSERGA
jgi:hypothetical protein